MKLDQKYFVPFLAVMAIITALLITFFTISSQKGQRQAFREAIIKQDSLKLQKMPLLNSSDSISVSDYKGKFVILDFWATWSNFSEEIHEQLAKLKQQQPDTLEVIAAVVEDQPEKIEAYIDRHQYPFHFVEGTVVFNKFGIPGMPTGIIYNPEGEIIEVLFGSSEAARFDSLSALMNDGK